MEEYYMHVAKWKVILKRLYSIHFQLDDILEKAKLWRQQTDQWLPGIGVGEWDE